jgi:hypothetical protein
VNKCKRNPHRFKYEARWMVDESYMEIIKKAWRLFGLINGGIFVVDLGVAK